MNQNNKSIGDFEKEPYHFSLPIYIVGGGSFAIKLASVLIDYDLDFEFVDEFLSSPLLGRNVYKTEDITNIDGIYIIAISIDVYAFSAIKRLTQKGIPKSQCLRLQYDSDSMMLDHMLSDDKNRLLKLFSEPLDSFSALESEFYISRTLFFNSFKKNQHSLIGICCLGRGGGYISHLGNIPTLVNKLNKTVLLSDTVIQSKEYEIDHFLMGQSAMISEESLGLVITAHVFPCSPKTTKKLSFSHMVYDFLLFDEQTFEHLEQADTHYVVIPSHASMKMHQDICKNKKFTNNIILIPGGYPRHDNNIIKFYEYASKKVVDCILYAPTLSSLPASNETDACFSILDAIIFIPDILNKFPNKKLIFRPHPEDLGLIKFELNHPRAKAFLKLLTWCEKHPRCEVDRGCDSYLDSFSRSSLIISDTSSIAFSFSLLTGRPVILYSSDHKSLIRDYNDCQFITDRNKFSFLAGNNNELYEIVNRILCGNSDYSIMSDFCEKTIYNIGFSEKYISDNFDYILNDIRHPDWWYSREHVGVDTI
ncbi:CDP-glycerol glycerophosphotransferase family protein [Shewanella morhuae]|uniref:CDP-Glycerol:Poly(Glycerophosphate) glycerophosphotransferase n=1 Tax=Shewanella morhuae TaxID=365591 RepID=A0A380A7Z3_9GAMM|nr:CDP-glycerol glycerophosphotransferase family protein [Shewanella morhuae]SUI76030.1 CDP-Glycerol:Poly(glycerophosphate) glycerophosphotransferase [Shewanella morhuae]